MFYVSTKFNYTPQVKYKLQRAQYKFPVPLHLMEGLKLFAVSG
jgi:hypothetical protein